MEQALWCELCQRDPLLPDPEPSALLGCTDEWVKYAELVQRQSTSEEYRPSLIDAKAKAKNKAELRRERGRTSIQCSECDKHRVVFSCNELSSADMAAFHEWAENIDYRCGMDITAAPELPVSVRTDESLSCRSPIEAAYYFKNLSECNDYELVCYHCGSSDGCKRDTELLLQWSTVMPQCAACRSNSIKPKCHRPVQNRAANVVSERRRVAEAQAQDASRQSQHVDAPERNDQGHDRVHQIVGARRAADGDIDYLIHWEKLDGVIYPQDQCTWEPADDIAETHLDYHFLKGKPVEVSTLKRKTPGEFTECKASTKRCKVVYTTNKADQWLNVTKPTQGHGWQVAGYDLWSEESDSSEESASSEEPNESEDCIF